MATQRRLGFIGAINIFVVSVPNIELLPCLPILDIRPRNKKINSVEEQNMSVLRDGEFFGEISLFDGKPHEAIELAEGSSYRLVQLYQTAAAAQTKCVCICHLRRGRGFKWPEVWQVGERCCKQAQSPWLLLIQLASPDHDIPGRVSCCGPFPELHRLHLG